MCIMIQVLFREATISEESMIRIGEFIQRQSKGISASTTLQYCNDMDIERGK